MIMLLQQLVSAFRGRSSSSRRRRGPGPDSSLDRFAAFLRQPRPSNEVRMVLVHLAQRLSGASRVELEIERGAGTSRASKVVARWPADYSPSEPPPSHPPLCLALRRAGITRGVLRLYSNHSRWPARVVERLTTLTVLAASAELGGPVDDDLSTATRDPLTGTHNLPFLHAFLAHALALGRRHGEPVSLLCIAIEGLNSQQRDPRGEVVADAALQRAAQTIQKTLRSSDVVARLDPFRLAVVLPATGREGSHFVAEFIRRAVAESAVTSGANPMLTASIGTATCPDHAIEPASLLAAAREALARASAGGAIAQIHSAPERQASTSTLMLSLT